MRVYCMLCLSLILYACFLSQSCKCWPQKFSEINNKMKLRNFLIDWLKAKELGWPRYQADSLGKEFVVLLADALWYLEGRHDRFKKQSKPIPTVFTEFPRFNLPKQSKHRRAETATCVLQT